MRKKRRYRKKS